MAKQRIILIGAGALQMQGKLSRYTSDLDLVLMLESDEYPGALAGHPAWESNAKQAQRWVHKQGIELDLLPAGPRLLQTGYVQWSSGHRMSLEGFSLLADVQQPFINRELAIEMATVPIVVVLKMIAWLDRPGERQRDLDDLAWLLANYLDEASDNDFERMITCVERSAVGMQHAIPFSLGEDVGSLEGAGKITRRFVAALEERGWALGRMQNRAPAALHPESAFDAAWQAFKRGLGLL